MSHLHWDTASQLLWAICLHSQFSVDVNTHHYRHTAPSQSLSLLFLGCSIIDDTCCQGNDEQREVCCRVFYFPGWAAATHDDWHLNRCRGYPGLQRSLRQGRNPKNRHSDWNHLGFGVYRAEIEQILHGQGQSLVEHLEIKWCGDGGHRYRCSCLPRQTEWICCSLECCFI